ncbi:phosphotransferase [Streptomyces cavourensis]
MHHGGAGRDVVRPCLRVSGAAHRTARRRGPPHRSRAPAALRPDHVRGAARGDSGHRRGGALLARLLRDLHAIPPRVSADPGDCILHLDLHPANVMLTERGPVVIDWSTATEGPPGFDRAMSALTLARVALDPELPAPEAQARTLLASLLAELADDGGADAADLARARAHQQENPFLTAPERDCLDAAVGLVLSCAP